jgi:hypothetical protein
MLFVALVTSTTVRDIVTALGSFDTNAIVAAPLASGAFCWSRSTANAAVTSITI